LLTEPRKTSESSAFTHLDVKKYQKYINPNVVVIHRINECDERKNTDFVNEYLIEANKVSDFTIFVSTWLKDLFIKQGLSEKNSKVILAGANNEIFHNKGYKTWNGVEKLKIVTHHWGANWNKGFREYIKLDQLLSEATFKDKFEFTYIGNIPKDIELKNTKVIAPSSGKKLANLIKENHIYLTASLNEPSGNHHIEAAQCGLPLLYINSGGIPEYCTGYGIEFNEFNFVEKLEEIREKYFFYLEKMNTYPHNAKKMSEEYVDTFNAILNDRILVKNNIEKMNFKYILNKKFFLMSLKLKKFLK